MCVCLHSAKRIEKQIYGSLNVLYSKQHGAEACTMRKSAVFLETLSMDPSIIILFVCFSLTDSSLSLRTD